ncbi:hypothetical protein M413DRAFT_387613 [Hebeloma cylindrosporum]|uniref:F-box domain-containing protein n=1 Tax=Hebeloma cylindrosporum TaxID=76867 RepID=A0A0C2YRT4_HEBCY|nr:hypothetical protein M413DRAFT_387613 [Hebeloma cylindrosporum h7]
MPSTSILPLEIEQTILDLLAEDDQHHSALKACSLACQAFLPTCRKHIFKIIVIKDHNAEAFERLVHKRPEIADYIRDLDYTIGATGLTSLASIQESLKRISKLQFLAIRRSHVSLMPEFDWNNNPIRPALLHLLHLPTLVHFKVTNFSNFILSDLAPCVNLKYLHIDLHTSGAAETTFPESLPARPIQLNGFTAEWRSVALVTQLFRARLPDGQPLIDFGSLSKIKVTLESSHEGEALQELFRGCRNLAEVDISFWECWDVTPSLADMLGPSMQTLKHLIVNTEVEDVRQDPLFGIPSELEKMRTQNVIESVTIGVMVGTDPDFHQGDDWGRLDEALTTTGWFSLKRVSLNILIVRYSSRDNDLDVALRKFLETQFPRLSTSNSVLFELKVTITSI